MIPLKDDNPTEITPLVTVSIIGLATAAFLYQLSLGDRLGQVFVYQYGTIPSVLFGHHSLSTNVATIAPAITLLTSMFLHGGFLHLIGNMLYLWIFGNNVEDAMGHVRFIIFYVLSGIAAAMSHALTDPTSNIPMIGASGAISGVLGAYLLLYPRAYVLVLIPLGFFTRMMYIPAWAVLGFWFLLQLASGGASLGRGGGGVAWFAHVGGFVTGMLLVGFFKRRSVRFFNPPHAHPSRFTSRW